MRELCIMEVGYVSGGENKPAPSTPPQDPSKNGPGSQMPKQEQKVEDGLDSFAEFVGDVVNGVCSLKANSLGSVAVCAAIGEAVSEGIKKAGEVDAEKHPLPRFPAH